MQIAERILCNQVKILEILSGRIPDVPGNNTSTLYTNSWVGEETVDLDNDFTQLIVPAIADYCEIEIKGEGTVLRRMDVNPTLLQSNQFRKDDLFSLTSRDEMNKSIFTSTTINKLFVNYYRIIPK